MSQEPNNALHSYGPGAAGSVCCNADVAGGCSRPVSFVVMPDLTAIDPAKLRQTVSALAGIPFAAAFTFYQPFALSLGIERVADFLVSYSITAMIVRGPLGGLADRAGRLRVTALSLVLYTCAALLMIGLSRLGLVLTGAAFGAAHGLFYPALNAHALEGAPPGVRAKVTGLFNGSFNVGFSLGSLALGFVALRWSYAAVYVVGAGCALAALALLPGRRAMLPRA